MTEATKAGTVGTKAVTEAKKVDEVQCEVTACSHHTF